MVKKRINIRKLQVDMSVCVGKIQMRNPIMVASGTFGYGLECGDLVDVRQLGALVTKTITCKPRVGNPPPRIAETPSGLLNSIGLENEGIEIFVKKKLPHLKILGVPIIVSIGGENISDFTRLARILDGVSGISGIEINISCPNLVTPTLTPRNSKLKLFSQDKRAVYKIVKMVKEVTNLTVITKLTPNVTDITETAKAAEEAGSDAISLVNTYMGMAVDVTTKRPLLGNIIGGVSGPAIKPMAIKAVWDVYNTVDIPIIGMGGITSLEDVLAFILCGATAVALGSINLIEPKKSVEIINALKYYIRLNKIKKLTSLIGALETE